MAPVPHSCCSHHQDLNGCISTCMALCHCAGGKHSQLPALCSSVRLTLSCKAEDDGWSDQLCESSHGQESCHSCTKCHKAVTELFTCCPKGVAVINGMWASRLGLGPCECCFEKLPWHRQQVHLLHSRFALSDSFLCLLKTS